MGNCQSDYPRHHVRIEAPGVRKLVPSVRKTRRKILISCDGQDGIFFDESLDPTTPLSPDATTLTMTSSFSTPLDPFESPSPLSLTESRHDASDAATVLSPSGVHVLDVSPLPPSSRYRKHKLTSPFSSRNRYEQSRRNFSSALRARLERSTFTHTNMTSPRTKETYQDRDIPFFSWGDFGTNLASRFSEESQEEKEESNEFSDDRANIWAEIETEESVATVSMFRHRSDLNRINLAVASENGTIAVYEILAACDVSQSAKLASIFTFDHKTRIRSIDFSSDGEFLAVGGDDCICTVYCLVHRGDELCGASVLAKAERVDRICAVRFNPHSNLLAIGGFDGKVAIFDTDTLAQYSELKVVNEVNLDGLVFALDWSSDGRYLACGGSNRKCTILDASDAWKIVAEILRSSPVHSVKWTPSNKGELAIGSSDTAIFDFNKMLIKHKIASEMKTISMRNFNRRYTICWSPSGNYLVIGDSLGECTLFEAKTYAKVQEFHRPGSINAICWEQTHADGTSGNEFLVTGSEDKKVAIIKAGNETSKKQKYCQQSVVWVFNENAFKEIDECNEECPTMPLVKATASNVVAVSFSRGSTSRSSAFMAYATDDNQVTVLSTSDWSLIAEISFPQPVTALAFTNGSKYLAYGCSDSRLYVSETFPNWSLVANIELPSPVHNSLVYSQSNRLLGAGTYDGNFLLFNPENKHIICGSIEGNESPITSVDWSSKTIAIGKEDGTVQLYDSEKLQSGDIESIATVTRRNGIRNIAFGLSGRFLAIGTSDGLVSIYSEKGGWVLCHQLQSLKGGVVCLTWSPTSRHLAVGDDQGLIKIVDTVFWADVEEAKHPFHHADDNAVPSSRSALSFSQDGKLLAFATSNNGVRVVNCSYWRLQFLLEQADKDVSDITLTEI